MSPSFRSVAISSGRKKCSSVVATASGTVAAILGLRKPKLSGRSTDFGAVSGVDGVAVVEGDCGADVFSPVGAVAVCPNIVVAVTGTATIALTKSRLRIELRLA